MLQAVGHVIYLHGFASSPASGKAERFRREVEACGAGFSCPDLNAPAFETLTTSRMLAQVHDLIVAAPRGPVALVGSSLGAFVALHAADLDTTGRVDRLILLAPAVDFGGNRLQTFGPYTIDDWKRAGALTVFHYADNVERQIGFALYEDAARYDAMTLPSARPTLVFQGSDDDVVNPAIVAAWAAERPQVDLRLLADGHQLGVSINHIWTESATFLGLRPARRL